MNVRILLLGLGVVAVTAGCGSNSSGGSVNTPTPGTTPTHTQSASGPGSSSSPTSAPTATPTVVATATVTTTAIPVAQACKSQHLQLLLGDSQGAAGTSYQPVIFTNLGSKPCSLFGYPGVSFVDASGATIGKPASEDSGRKVSVRLAAGGQANALLREPNSGNFSPSACNETTADRLRVYPPGETVALFVHDPEQICASGLGRTGIGPVSAGNGG